MVVEYVLLGIFISLNVCNLDQPWYFQRTPDLPHETLPKEQFIGSSKTYLFGQYHMMKSAMTDYHTDSLSFKAVQDRHSDRLESRN